MNAKSNAELILEALDERLDTRIELTLYGRAALHLGFAQGPPEFAFSADIDAVLWVGQAQELADRSNFWEAVEEINLKLAKDGLYASHFFEETQVILRPSWKGDRAKIEGPWSRLSLFRLGNIDLLLSKLMRDDPQDLRDAMFIVRSARLDNATINKAISEARVPPLLELREQFAICCEKLRRQLEVS